MKHKIPYYVVKKGRGFWQPDAKLRAHGYASTPLGPDGPEARQIAEALTETMRDSRDFLKEANNPLRLRLMKSLKNARERAKKRELAFDLTFDDVAKMVRDNGLRCAVTGIPFQTKAPEPGMIRQPFAPSLDRIDNNQGYVPGNVRIVLTVVNYAMNVWGADVLATIGMGAAAVISRAKREQKLELLSKQAQKQLEPEST